MTDETPAVGSVESQHVSSSSMADNEGVVKVETEKGTITQVPVDTQWSWDKDLPGEGEKPDWVDPKYGSIAEQAKANMPAQKLIGELKNRLGQFAEWQAPENYDFSAINDKTYSFDSNTAEYNNFIALLRSHNIPQEFASELVKFHKTEMTKDYVDSDEEMKKLGSDAKEQLDSITNWTKNNLSERATKWIFAHARTAEDISVVKEIRAAMQQSAIPTGVTTGAQPYTLQSHMSDWSQNLYKGKNYSQNLEAREEWEKKLKEFI